MEELEHHSSGFCFPSMEEAVLIIPVRGPGMDWSFLRPDRSVTSWLAAPTTPIIPTPYWSCRWANLLTTTSLTPPTFLTRRTAAGLMENSRDSSTLRSVPRSGYRAVTRFGEASRPAWSSPGLCPLPTSSASSSTGNRQTRSLTGSTDQTSTVPRRKKQRPLEALEVG